VPSLRLDVRPSPTGRLDDGRLDVPDSARSVVWWAYGAAPGEAQGTVVLAGHVSWAGRWGRFGSLTRLRPGARVYVDRADGRRVGYRVASVTEVAKARLDRLGVFRTGGRPALVLLTCGGHWDATRRSYDDNVVVRAVPVN
ncbi:MAG TPA: class F sortase, partial [Streptosporangiales bacterium]